MANKVNKKYTCTENIIDMIFISFIIYYVFKLMTKRETIKLFAN